MKEVQPKSQPSAKPRHLKVKVDRKGMWEERAREYLVGEGQISLISLLLSAE